MELRDALNKRYDTFDEEMDARIEALQQAVLSGEKLFVPVSDKGVPELSVELGEFTDEMVCISSYVDADAVVFDPELDLHPVPVGSWLKALICDQAHGGLFVGTGPGKGFVITKGMAQRILEPVLQSERYEICDEVRLEHAIRFAVSAHSGQYRKGSRIPYIVHPMEVMTILQSMDADIDLLIAGLLHDVTEDAGISIEEIDKHFGLDVAALVAAHSENKDWSWENRKRFCIAETGYGSKRLQMLVMADTISNQQAILKDISEIGQRVWEKFKRGREDQAWYYGGKQDALWKMGNDPQTRKVYWEMVDSFKDIFVRYYLDVSNHRIYQLCMNDECYVFDRDTREWEAFCEGEPQGICITRIFAETIEDAWKLDVPEKRQWREWLFSDVEEPSSDEIVQMIIQQLTQMGAVRGSE